MLASGFQQALQRCSNEQIITGHQQELKIHLLDVAEFLDQLEESSAVYLGVEAVCESQNLYFVVPIMHVICVQSQMGQKWTPGTIIFLALCTVF